MTLQKVAKLAKVSVSTASKALSDSKDVSEETRVLVHKAAEELGYFSTMKKRRYESRRHSSSTIGIICPEIISVHYSGIVTALCRQIDELGGKASVFITEFSKEKLKSIFERCILENEIDAVISLDGFPDEVNFAKFPLPTVFFGASDGKYCVNSDIAHGIFKAVRHLFEMGHKKIAFAGEPLTVSKQKAFKQAMTEIVGGFEEELIFCEAGRFEESGREVGVKICDMKKEMRPTAVICGYDEIAYGLMRALRENDLRIPDDLSVIGINDIPTSRFLETPLTSIRSDSEKAVSAAMEILSDLLSGKEREKTVVTVDCELVIRSSVAKI